MFSSGRAYRDEKIVTRDCAQNAWTDNAGDHPWLARLCIGQARRRKYRTRRLWLCSIPHRERSCMSTQSSCFGEERLSANKKRSAARGRTQPALGILLVA